MENKYHSDNLNDYNYTLINTLKKDENLNSKTILEIGCNEARNLCAIKTFAPDCQFYGVDINDTAIMQAYKNLPEGRFIIENVENLALPWKDVQYDYIFFIDVLEHLHNPKEVLTYVKSYLKPEGKIICSIPNLANWAILANLIMYNRFPYTETGLLDSTHVHLFTRDEFILNVKECGYTIESFVYINLGTTEKEKEYINKLLPLCTFNESRETLEAFEFMFVLTK